MFSKKKELMDRLLDHLDRTKVITYLPSDRNMHTSVLSINVEGYEPHEIGVILGEEFGIAVRTGFHCAPYVHKLLDTEKLGGTVRISLGYFNTVEDVDALVSAIESL